MPRCSYASAVTYIDFFFRQESSLSSAVGSGGRGYAYFKFEPFVLHAICRTLEDAQAMVRVDLIQQ